MHWTEQFKYISQEKNLQFDRGSPVQLSDIQHQVLTWHVTDHPWHSHVCTLRSPNTDCHNCSHNRTWWSGSCRTLQPGSNQWNSRPQPPSVGRCSLQRGMQNLQISEWRNTTITLKNTLVRPTTFYDLVMQERTNQNKIRRLIYNSLKTKDLEASI